MKSKKITLSLTLALTTLACGFNVQLPKIQEPGPDATTALVVPATGAEETHLKLSFGAGELNLVPGTGKNLVDGSATYNYPDLKPTISANAGEVEISVGDVTFNSIPNLNKFKNQWDLALGPDPMALTITAGAYRAAYELGGLALTSLSVQDGAADVNLSFSALNPSEMSTFTYDTGASSIKLTGLANANFSTLNFKGGAGNYTLDFSGALQRDASVKIETGLSDIILVIPEGVNAVVDVDSGASDVNATTGWQKSGETYTQTGTGPTLTIHVEIGAGNLILTR
ncbi:MAG: hypothetical protein IT310_01755 [Anaerolineales bacterium]|nr:hypothetical protein [Anaerolineales bacterium]